MTSSATDAAAGLASARSPSASRTTDDEFSLGELLQVVHRRRWLLVGCIFLAGLAGMAVVAAITPVYDARALLVIEPDGAGRTGATVATASQTPDSASVDSQVQILGSRSLAREVIEQLGLGGDPELTGAGDVGAGLLGRLLPASVARPGPARPMPSVDVVGRFLDRLVVKREGKSHVIVVLYRSHDPDQAARIANRIAERYIADQLDRKEAARRRQSGWFDAQLQALKGRLEGAEAALAAFRADSEARRDETFGTDPAEIAGLNAQLVAAVVERAGKAATLGRLRQQVESGNLSASLGELGSSALLDNLMALKAELLRREAELTGQYGERHPKIQDIRAEQDKLDRRIGDERKALLRQFEGQVARARAGEQALAGLLA